MQPVIVSHWREIATRAAMIVGGTVIVVAALVLMRHGDSIAPPPRVAASEIETVPYVAAPNASAPVAGGVPTDRIDAAWATRVAATAGIPVRALLAYASADLTVDTEQPGCGLGWNTIAAIGAIESVHGTIGDRQLRTDGFSEPAIRGPALDGRGFAAIRDTDGGAWDGDVDWDRAVGPLQFIPSTWTTWAADGNGDGIADPNQIDDAALATARYLCASGSVTGTPNWRAAVFSYNHLDSYVDDVAAMANRYAAAG